MRPHQRLLFALALALAFVVCGATSAHSQTISTIAGTAVPDGRPALLTAFSNSAKLAVDSGRNIFIADYLNSQVWSVDAATGRAFRFAGIGVPVSTGDGGPATLAGIAFPHSVAVSRAGDVYIGEGESPRIRRVDRKTGIITTVAGGGTSGRCENAIATECAGDLRSFALGSNDDVYVAANNVILRLPANGVRFTVVAGTNVRGSDGDGGPARDAQVNAQGQIAVSPNGNVYFVDAAGIRRIDFATGLISRYAGGGLSREPSGPALDADLRFASALAVDGDENLYVGVPAGIRKIDTNGRMVTVSTDVIPTAVVPGAGGTFLYFSRGRVKYADASGVVQTIAGRGDSQIFTPDGSAATATVLDHPRSVATFGRAVFVADTWASCIRRVDLDSGVARIIAGKPGTAGFSGDGGLATDALLSYPTGIAFDVNGDVYFVDSLNFRVRVISVESGRIFTVAGTGKRGFSGDGGPATQAEINPGPGSNIDTGAGIAIGSNRSIYLADMYNNRIRRIAPDGTITTVAGSGPAGLQSGGNFAGDGAAATNALLSLPNGVAVDSSGHLFISDTHNHRIRSVGADGIIRTVAGSGLATAEDGAALRAGFNTPTSVRLGISGELLVADSNNGRIRKIDRVTGTVSTLAGGARRDYSGDGGPAVSSGLNYPVDVAVSASGDIFIADSANDRVRAVFACRSVARPQLQQPASESTSVSLAPRLAWTQSNSAFSYDVYLDTVDPPRAIVAADLNATRYSPANLQALTKYYWKVVAKGDPFCAPFSTASSDVYSFTTTATCGTPGAFDATATQTANGLTIRWTDAARAATYDVYTGTANPPRLVARGLTSTSFDVENVAPATTYWWRVVAHAACDPTQTSEAAIRSMTTAGGCATPGTVMLTSPSDAAGDVSATAVLRWNATPNAGAYDLYLGSGSNPALYITDVVGTRVTVPRLTPGAEYSWRVVAKAACDPSRGTTSAVQRFTVSGGCAAAAAPEMASPAAAAAAGATYAITWIESAGMDDAGSYLVERSRDANFATVGDRQETTSTSASFLALSEGTYYHRVIAIAGCNRTRRSPASSTAKVTFAANANVVVFTVEPKGVITKLGDRLQDVKTSFTLENLGRSPAQVLVAPQLLGSVPFFRVVDPLGGDGAFVTLEPRQPKTLEVQFSGPPNEVPGTYQGIIYVSSTGEPLAFTPQAFVNLKVGGSANAAAPKFLVGGVEGDVSYFPPASGDDAARPALTVDITNSGDTPMDVVGEIGPEQWLKLEKDWNATPIPPRSFRPVRLFTQRTRAISGSALPRSTYFTVRNMNGQSARLLVQDTGGAVQLQGRGTLLAPGDRSLIVPLVKRYTALYVTNTSAAAVPVELIYTPDGVDGVDDKGVLRASMLVPGNDVLSMVDVVAQVFGLIGEPSGWIELRSAQETIGQLVVRAASREGTTLPVAMRGEGARLDSTHRLTGIDRTVVLIETSGREKTSVNLTLFDASGVKKSERTVEVPRYGTKRLDNLDGVTAEVALVNGGGAVIALAVDATSVVGSQPQARAISLSSLGRQTKATAKQIYAIPSASSGTAVRLHATQAANVKINGETLTINAGQTVSHQANGAVTIESEAPLTIAAGTHPVFTLASEALTGAGSSKPLIADGIEHLPGDGSAALVLTEHAGRPATVTVTLYEAGHRSRPLAEKDVTIPAKGQMRLDSLFASMGLETDIHTLDQRRKPRANVAVVVVPKSGEGLVSAVMITRSKAALLVPAGHIPLTVPQSRAATGSVTRRRAVGR